MLVSVPESSGDKVAKPRILLVAKDEKRLEAYLAALESVAECTLLDRIREIPDLLRQEPFKGILIDIQVNVKANYMEKMKIADSLAAMPSATLNFDAGRGLTRLLMLNQKHGTARTIAEFAGLCSSFQPEIIFPHDQGALHLNAVLSPVPDFSEGAERTFTMNISCGGCFLFTSDRHRFHPGEMVWIELVGLDNRSPIRAKICWKCEWGVSHAVPGIYVSFESVLEDQYEEIKTLAGLS